MKDAWEGICNAYLRAFCEKHDLDMEEAFWGNDDPGTIACVGGYFIEMEVIRYDIDHNELKGQFWRWYDYDLSISELEEDYRYYRDDKKFIHISYASFCKGIPLPYSQEEIRRMRTELDYMQGPRDHSEEYLAVMEELTGKDIRSKSRMPDVVWARFMVMYQMRKDGLTFKYIGDTLGKDHATVVHGVRMINDMLDMPRMYPEEIRLWQQFQKSIKDE